MLLESTGGLVQVVFCEDGLKLSLRPSACLHVDSRDPVHLKLFIHSLHAICWLDLTVSLDYLSPIGHLRDDSERGRT